MTTSLHNIASSIQTICNGTLLWRGGALVFALSLKAFFILLAAAAIAICLRRAAAAARHMAWLLGIACLLALPLLTLWQNVLPGRALGPLTVRSHMPIVAYVQPPAYQAVPARLPVDRGEVLTVTGQASGSLAAPISSPAPLRVASVADDPQLDSRGEALARAKRVAIWLFYIWIAGALALLARLAVSLIFAGRIAGRCAELNDGPQYVLAEESARLLGGAPKITVRLGHTGAAPMVPMTLGLVRPVVLLPASAVNWPEDRLRAALLHEISHVRRRDWIWQVLAGVSCALYWFDPLVWIAARRLRAESEMACDDQVLVSGALPTDYAGHLLEMARSLSRARSGVPTAIAAVNRPQIEGRLAAILDRARLRRPVSGRARAFALLFALLILVPLGLLRFESQAAARTRAPIARLTSAISHLSSPVLAVEGARIFTHGSLDLPDEALSPSTKGKSKMLSLKPTLSKTIATLAGLSLLAAPTAASAQSPPAPQPPPPDATAPVTAAPVVAPASPNSDATVNAPIVTLPQWSVPSREAATVPASPSVPDAPTPPATQFQPLQAPGNVGPGMPDVAVGQFPATGLQQDEADLHPRSNPFVTPNVKQVDGPGGQHLYSIFADSATVGHLLTQLCQAAGVGYIVDMAPANPVSVNLNSQTFDAALRSILEASDPPITYTVENNVYHFRMKGDAGASDAGLPQKNVTLDLDNVPFDKALNELFDNVHASYSVVSAGSPGRSYYLDAAKGIPGTIVAPATNSNSQSPVTVHLHGVPFPAALRAVLNSTSPTLTYTVKDGIVYIKPAGPEAVASEDSTDQAWDHNLFLKDNTFAKNGDVYVPPGGAFYEPNTGQPSATTPMPQGGQPTPFVGPGDSYVSPKSETLAPGNPMPD